MRTSFTRISRTLLLLSAGWATHSVQAVPLIDTTGAPVTSSVYPFGEPNAATIGQTFSVTGPETRISSFSFRLDDYPGVPTVVDFSGYLYAWDGTKATGAQLFASGMRSTSNNGGAGGYETFSFDAGDITLLAGRTYVAFLSATAFFTGVYRTSTLELMDGYADGNFVYDRNGSDFGQLTSHTWASVTDGFIGTRDTWFVARFSAATPVPEPGAAGMMLSGALALVIARRRRCR